MDILKNVKNFIVKNKTPDKKQSQPIIFAEAPICFYDRFTTISALLDQNLLKFISYLHENDFNSLKIYSRTQNRISFDTKSEYWIIKPLKVAQSSIKAAEDSCNHIDMEVDSKSKPFDILKEKNQKFISLFRNPYERAKSQLNFINEMINRSYRVQFDDWHYFKESFGICPDSHSYPQVFFIPFEINGNFFKQVAGEFIKAKDSLPANPNYTLLTSTIRKALQNLDYTQILKESNHEYTYILIEPGAKPVQTLFKDYLNV